MATARLAIVLLVLGTVLLLVVQNTAPALPLVFLGARTLALPLGVWLGLAIALGALTTVGLILVLPFTRPGGRSGRSPAYKYKAQPFYEPTHPDATGASATSADAASQSSFRSGRRDRPTGEWQAWTDLKSPNQWNDWDALSQAHQQSQAPSSRSAASQTATATSFWPPNWFGDRQAAQKQQIDQSLEELTQDWGDMENRAYTAPGVSPVDDSLDDINQGWDNHPAPPPPDIETSQSPKRVYRDGSIYSYSYRQGDGLGQTDHIYAPADDQGASSDGEGTADVYGPGDSYYDAPPNAPAAPLNQDRLDDDLEDPEIAEDGVVDADYRVIIPPYQPPESSQADSDWRGETDDWDDADDALTP